MNDRVYSGGSIKLVQQVAATVLAVVLIGGGASLINTNKAVSQIQSDMAVDDVREADDKEAVKENRVKMTKIQADITDVKTEQKVMRVEQEYIRADVTKILNILEKQ